jgi:hypothetical protein
MAAVEHSITVHARPEDLFALTQDYTLRLRWDPFLREARLVGGACRAAPGVRAWCVAWHGLGMETEYVSFNPPRVAAVRMTRGPALLASFAGSWRFAEAGPGRTRVCFRYRLAARPRWLRRVLDPLLRTVFARDTARRLLSLRRAVEETDLLRSLPAAPGN